MDSVKGYDFAGWVTKNDVRCADGNTICQGAFRDQDGTRVPLVWMHNYSGIENVLGNVLLQNRPEGVYGYGSLNDTESADIARLVLKHDDVTSMSIYANKLTRNSRNEIVHGTIREVSLVLAGANPEARIEDVVSHGDMSEDVLCCIGVEDNTLKHSDEGMIQFEPVKNEDHIEHADSSKEDDVAEDSDKKATQTKETDNGESSSEKTVEDIVSTMNEDQKIALYYLIGQAVENGKNDNADDTETNENDKSNKEDNVKHNVFDNDGVTTSVDSDSIVHDAMMDIINEARDGYSMRKIFNDYVQHADNGDAIMHAATYGVDPVDYLFPDAKTVTNTPEFIRRDTGWVPMLMNRVHHTPFSRIKSVFADITADEARARGYIKGKLKKEEVFTLLKRTTTPTTIYKKQKMDRDDVIDITDFDVIAWLKSEMRGMLDEEIARAILVGDGRLSSDDDHIPEDHIRPIWTDADLFTIKSVIELEGTETEDDIARTFIRTAIKARKDYKGSGNPILFTTENFLTDMLLLEDKIGHTLYDSVDKLATKLRVSQIVTVEVMEGLTREVGDTTHTLMGIIVNPADYNVGADRGGAINMFDDFDIDYNQQKYLIETRCSGALIKPFSAIAIESAPKE